ncbi:hypothetical protein ASG39_07470 [Rhizobium sp. Leaf371]|nr:hypothetical protein ASG39_07470 [Rhizobium sp. Leaf371]
MDRLNRVYSLRTEGHDIMNQHSRRNARAIAIAKADDSRTQRILALTYTAAAILTAVAILGLATLGSF